MKWDDVIHSHRLRKAISRMNPLIFASIYLRHYTRYNFAEYHQLFKNQLLDNKLKRIVWIAFRESAKSVFAGLIYTLWCICYQQKRFIIFASDSSDNASVNMSSLISELELNKLLINDFGLLYIDPEEKMRSKKKTVKDFVTTNDVRVLARGIDQKVRGQRFRQYRPDLLIGDDLEDTRHATTAESRKKTMSWIEKEALPALDQNIGRAIILGNIVHYDCLVVQLAKKDNWAVLQVPIMSGDKLAWPARHTLTEKEAIEWNLTHPTEPKVSIEWIKFDKGSLNFAQEYLLIPQGDQEAIFFLNWIEKNYYDEVNLDDLDIYGGIDPAIRKKDKSDFSGLTFIGRHKKTGAIYTLFCEGRKITVSEQIDWIMEMCRVFDYDKKIVNGQEVWEHKNRLRAFGIEVNAYQLALKQLVDEKSQKEGIYLPTKEITTKDDKRLKFKGKLSPMVENGQIKFKKDQQQLIADMVQFPNGLHDDTIDSLYSAVLVMEKDVAGSGTYQWFKQQYEQQMGGQPQGLTIQDIIRLQGR